MNAVVGCTVSAALAAARQTFWPGGGGIDRLYGELATPLNDLRCTDVHRGPGCLASIAEALARALRAALEDGTSSVHEPAGW